MAQHNSEQERQHTHNEHARGDRTTSKRADQDEASSPPRSRFGARIAAALQRRHAQQESTAEQPSADET